MGIKSKNYIISDFFDHEKSDNAKEIYQLWKEVCIPISIRKRVAKTVYTILSNKTDEIEKMWGKIAKDVITGGPRNPSREQVKERISYVTNKRNEIILSVLGDTYKEISYIPGVNISIEGFLDISKLETKGWEGTVKSFEEKGVTKLQLLEDKLSPYLS